MSIETKSVFSRPIFERTHLSLKSHASNVKMTPVMSLLLISHAVTSSMSHVKFKKFSSHPVGFSDTTHPVFSRSGSSGTDHFRFHRDSWECLNGLAR